MIPMFVNVHQNKLYLWVYYAIITLYRVVVTKRVFGHVLVSKATKRVRDVYSSDRGPLKIINIQVHVVYDLHSLHFRAKLVMWTYGCILLLLKRVTNRSKPSREYVFTRFSKKMYDND